MDESVGPAEERRQKIPPLQSCELVPPHACPVLSTPPRPEARSTDDRPPVTAPLRRRQRVTHDVILSEDFGVRACGRKSRALSSGCFGCSTWGGSVGAPSHLLQSIAPSTSRQTSQATINPNVAWSKVSGLGDAKTVHNGAFLKHKNLENAKRGETICFTLCSEPRHLWGKKAFEHDNRQRRAPQRARWNRTGHLLNTPSL